MCLYNYVFGLHHARDIKWIATARSMRVNVCACVTITHRTVEWYMYACTYVTAVRLEFRMSLSQKKLKAINFHIENCVLFYFSHKSYKNYSDFQ